MDNKVKYGLSNVYYAVLTEGAGGTVTYGTPVAWPGAVSLTLDPEGELSTFRADNTDYWVGQNNNGYTGSLETALIPDSFRTDVLGEAADRNDVIVEQATPTAKHFALLFQFEGDANATRHVMYNVTAARPSVTGNTTDRTITPETETVDLTAGSIKSAALNANIVKARCPQGNSQYDTWFTTVYQPVAA